MARHELSSATLKRLERPAPFWINGRQVQGLRTVPLCNPATGQTFAEVHAGAARDVDEAVAAARRAFTNPAWAGMNPAMRARILWRLAELIDANATELAELETLCMGKPIAAAKRMEVPFFAETFRYFSGWCTKISGSSAPLSFPAGDLHGLTLQEPIGVVGMILPWNGPLVIAGWKIAPALATGCTCVIKPAEATPLSLLRFAELAKEAGVPDGVINIVTGSGAEIGSAISRHPDIDKLAFTGSTDTGRGLLHAAADSNLKKLTLELGGKSPVIVFDDADLEAAVDGAVDAIFGNSGQVCVAGSRLYLQTSIRDTFVARLLEKTAMLRVGDPLDEDTQLGPIASQTHLHAIHRQVGAGWLPAPPCYVGVISWQAPAATIRRRCWRWRTSPARSSRTRYSGRCFAWPRSRPSSRPSLWPTVRVMASPAVSGRARLTGPSASRALSVAASSGSTPTTFPILALPLAATGNRVGAANWDISGLSNTCNRNP